jgi:DNA-binding CsgD family transcriptional regulator
MELGRHRTRIGLAAAACALAGGAIVPQAAAADASRFSLLERPATAADVLPQRLRGPGGLPLSTSCDWTGARRGSAGVWLIPRVGGGVPCLGVSTGRSFAVAAGASEVPPAGVYMTGRTRAVHLIAGAVPDGVTGVRVAFADGTERSVPVRSSTYKATSTSAITALTVLAETDVHQVRLSGATEERPGAGERERPQRPGPTPAAERPAAERPAPAPARPRRRERPARERPAARPERVDPAPEPRRQAPSAAPPVVTATPPPAGPASLPQAADRRREPSSEGQPVVPLLLAGIVGLVLLGIRRRPRPPLPVAAPGPVAAPPPVATQARELIERGATLRARGARVEAREPLRQALDLAHRLEEPELVTRALAELVASGARPRRAASSGLDSLTTQERRVAGMAAAGSSNRDISEQLFVTDKTVEGHLANVYRKLGINSRSQIPRELVAAGDR